MEWKSDCNYVHGNGCDFEQAPMIVKITLIVKIDS